MRSQPEDLVAQIVFAWMRIEEIGQRPDEHSLRGAGSPKASALREDDPAMLLTRIEVPAMCNSEVADVLGDDRTSLRRRDHEQLQIRKRQKRVALRHRDHVVTALAQLGRNRAVVLFVEQEPQRSALCSLRHAASSSVAAASFAAIRSSISWRFAA